jgi:hypothetical protein
MIFIFIFGMTMRTFAWANMGSLRGHNFGQFQFYYATPTQKSFFCQKKAVFFRCHASRFLLRKPFFYVFWAFIFA